MLRLILCCSLSLLLPTRGFLQPDTTHLPTDTAIVLPQVMVEAGALNRKLTGSRIEQWDSTTLSPLKGNHLGDLLERESGIFIKSYGLGSSATTSIRGGNAGQTSVLWNGLPLQSPMLGQLDFSLLPIAFTDGISLQYGGSTAAWGSGAIGGVIGLQNKPDFDKNLILRTRTSVGSFGFFDQQLKLQLGQGAWRSITRVSYQQAENDFSYRIRPDLPSKEQSNAHVQQMGVLQEFYWRPTYQQQLSIRIWAQENQREIPPTTVQNQSEVFQADAFVRSAVHWKMVGERITWEARAGLFREKLDYQDDQILLRSFSQYWVGSTEVEGKWFISTSQVLHFGIGHTWMQADADAYNRLPEQHRTAPYLAFQQSLQRWKIQANLRQEMVDGNLIPLVPGLGIEGDILTWLKVGAKITRNYRLPSMNDLYWQPGGNPGLQPERGWSQEATLHLHQKQKKYRWRYSITGFNRKINNWILWSLRDDQPFWSANNIARVWSRGLEQRLSWNVETNDWQVALSGGYDYILSTNEVSHSNPRLEAGEQLIYTPKHQAFGKLDLHWKNLGLTYRHRFTGKVRAINTDYLPGYQVGFLMLNYAFDFSQWNAQLFFNLENVWNADYRVVERRPMPGRYFRTGIQFHFFKDNRLIH